MSTDRCVICPVFEHLVDDETLAYVVCGTGEPATDAADRPAVACG